MSACRSGWRRTDSEPGVTGRPLVTVLLTTHNGAAFLPAALAGILRQSFSDFELIAVDDASDDATAGILASCLDPRLRVITSARNLGVVGARNLGFAAVSGRYLALHDHDDLSLPDRLARQVAFLEQHPAIVLAATEVLIRREGHDTTPDHSVAGDPPRLRWNCLTDNPLTYSAVMLRMDAVRKLGEFMRPAFEYADDFDLYHRLLRIGDIARLPEPLVIYRWHAANTTHAAGTRLDHAAARVLHDAYSELLGGNRADEAALVVRHLCNRHAVPDRKTLDFLGDHLQQLLTAFLVRYCTTDAEASAIAAEAGRTWWRLVRTACRSGHPGLMRAYSNHRPLAAGYRPGMGDIAGSLLAGGIRRTGALGRYGTGKLPRWR